jgi:cytochrome P450
MNAVLAPHRIAECEPFIRSLCLRLIDDIEAQSAKRPHEPVDMVAAFANPVPTTVIAHVLGVPTTDNTQFGRWTDELLAAMDSDARADRPVHDPTASSPEFMAYLDNQIDLRIRHLAAGGEPGNDIISRYLRAEICGERLSPIAIRSQLVMLVIAGNETTRNLIGNMLHRLASDPDLFQWLQRDQTLVPIAIEESLRVDTPVQILARTCVKESKIDGVTIPPGDRIVIGVASANRDEHMYDYPAAFRLDRPNPRDHVAFGAGPHVCPGAALARLEGIVAIKSVLERFATLMMPPGAQFDANPVFWAHGPRTLPLLIS